jgi:tRNA threonylcarbamoyladenosine biosynthesis protein TsaE
MSDPSKANPVLHFTTNSVNDLDHVVQSLIALFSVRTVLLLEGPVGAGKTELVKKLTQALGLPPTASPSFAIHHRYEKDDGSEDGMDHVDLYRLDSEDDLESTGFWDLFGAERGLVVIEWSDRLNQTLLPLNWKKIKVEITLLSDPTKRTLRVTELK